jgi:hypothetical protein
MTALPRLPVRRPFHCVAPAAARARALYRTIPVRRIGSLRPGQLKQSPQKVHTRFVLDLEGALLKALPSFTEEDVPGLPLSEKTKGLMSVTFKTVGGRIYLCSKDYLLGSEARIRSSSHVAHSRGRTVP